MKQFLNNLSQTLTLVCFVAFLFWILCDNSTAKIVFIIAFALQIYAIFTKDNPKKS